MSEIPSQFPWARRRADSTHVAGLGGFFRSSAPPLMLAAIAAGIGVLLLSVHFTRGPQTNTLIPGSVIAALALPLVIWPLIRFLGGVREVRLYPEGLVWKQGGRWRGWEWHEVEQVFRKQLRVNGMTSVCEVILAGGGKKVTLTHALNRWDRMADVIQTETTGRLLPLARESYQAGETVGFRKVSIAPTGLTIERKEIEFEQIKDIEVGNGYLIVYPEGRRGVPEAVALGDIPNYLVLLTLLEESPAPSPRVRG